MLLLLILRHLRRKCQNKGVLQPPDSTLKEELGRLFLWGEAFDKDELENALDQCEELRNDVIDLLAEVGAFLLQGKSSKCAVRMPRESPSSNPISRTNAQELTYSVLSRGVLVKPSHASRPA